MVKMSRTMPPTPVAAPWLDVARMVVRLGLERHGVALADVDHTGVLADADQQDVLRFGRYFLAELAQVDLARLVGAMLAPHDGVHGQFTGRRPPAEDVFDPCVLVLLDPEFGERQHEVGS
jgi:hypothetical protein